jgi:HD-GYP domain-containing protein (c-di-GMP phosphodiesterase class II)
VDAYDAMTSVRPYRRPFSHEEAAEELVRCSGVQFDPRCVEAFLKYISHASTPWDSRSGAEAAVH